MLRPRKKRGLCRGGGTPPNDLQIRRRREIGIEGEVESVGTEISAGKKKKRETLVKLQNGPGVS